MAIAPGLLVSVAGTCLPCREFGLGLSDVRMIFHEGGVRQRWYG